MKHTKHIECLPIKSAICQQRHRAKLRIEASKPPISQASNPIDFLAVVSGSEQFTYPPTMIAVGIELFPELMA